MILRKYQCDGKIIALLLQRYRVMRYVSKFVLRFTWYGSYAVRIYKMK